jgi:hypothetical protein
MTGLLARSGQRRMYGYRLESRAYHGLNEQFIRHSHFVACFRIKHLSAFERLTENPRVGGSIPPLASIQIKSLDTPSQLQLWNIR